MCANTHLATLGQMVKAKFRAQSMFEHFYKCFRTPAKEPLGAFYYNGVCPSGKSCRSFLYTFGVINAISSNSLFECPRGAPTRKKTLYCMVGVKGVVTGIIFCRLTAENPANLVQSALFKNAGVPCRGFEHEKHQVRYILSHGSTSAFGCYHRNCDLRRATVQMVALVHQRPL